MIERFSDTDELIEIVFNKYIGGSFDEFTEYITKNMQKSLEEDGHYENCKKYSEILFIVSYALRSNKIKNGVVSVDLIKLLGILNTLNSQLMNKEIARLCD